MQNAVKVSKPRSGVRPYVRPATREDCLELASRLRKEDLEELSHSTGLPPDITLLYGLKVSDETHVVVWGDTLIAIFGVGGVPGQIGFPWMLASDELRSIRKSFLRECKGWVGRMKAVYGHLENHVWVRNEVHIQWLQWLGFKFDEAAPHGVTGELFYRFYIKEEYV